MSDPITRLNAALEGRYRVRREIGEGGMATVYLADDLRHERKVALKVLKPELAAVVGAERFLAEIKTTANLQHPHILPLHDSGEADGFLFYVMPYIEGETLRDRLAREKQLPVDEAVRIATDVAEALHSAHEQGVIHRDIKPANILLSRGRPLVADFGIALAVSAAGGGRLTETGLSMGTPFYMSPEQASADRDPSAASDVYSLACVLYEMLVGEPPHAGGSAQAVLAKILTEDVRAPTKARPAIPANVDAAIRKALEKLPADRFAGAEEFARALADRSFRLDAHAGAAPGAPSPGDGALKAVAIVATLAAVLFGGLYLRVAPRGGASGEVKRQRIVLGSDITRLPQGVSSSVALAPDGSGVLFADTIEAGEAQYGYWWKPTEVADPIRIPNMDDALAPVFSPDGEWVAFVVNRQLRKQPLRGGTTVLLADGVTAAGAQALAWLQGGVLILENSGPILERISDDGVERDTISDVSVTGFPVHASGLPGGGAALVSSCTDGTCIAYQLLLVDLERDTVAVLADEVLRAWPGPEDFVIYLDRQGSVFAARLDRAGLRLDPPIPLFDGVLAAGDLPTTGEMQVGADGSLVYVRGQPASSSGYRVVWVDRQGAVEPVDPDWELAAIDDPALSPTNDRLAVTIGGQIWVKELPDGPLSQITVEETISDRATWSLDEASIIFLSNDGAGLQVHSVRADGSSSVPDTLIRLEVPIYEALRPDAQGRLLFRSGTAGAMEIGYVDSTGDATPLWLLDSEFDERNPALSPDGRWLAYTSNRSGRDEVYVRPFPEVDRLFQVSTNGGTEPMWAHNGHELFYRDGDGWMTVATVAAEADFAVASRERLFDATGYRSDGFWRLYDVARDDDRFVMLQIGDVQEQGDVDLILVENWFEEVRAALRR